MARNVPCDVCKPCFLAIHELLRWRRRQIERLHRLPPCLMAHVWLQRLAVVAESKLVQSSSKLVSIPAVDSTRLIAHLVDAEKERLELAKNQPKPPTRKENSVARQVHNATAGSVSPYNSLAFILTQGIDHNEVNQPHQEDCNPTYHKSGDYSSHSVYNTDSTETTRVSLGCCCCPAHSKRLRSILAT